MEKRTQMCLRNKKKLKLIRGLEHHEFKKLCGTTENFPSQNWANKVMRLYFNCIFYKIFQELGDKVIYFLFVSVTNEDNVFSFISLMFMMHGIQEPPAHCTTAPLTLTVRKAVEKNSSTLLVRWQI